MSYAYDQYLAEHIGNVNKGLHWMLDNLGLSQEEKNAIETAMTEFNHDESKYSTEEYDAYDKYFYGGNRSYKVVQDFSYAWLHHIHQNPHHWQYWVLLEDDPEAGLPYKTLPIPLPYIFEMIADWWSFSWKAGNLFEIFNWYAEHREKQYINPNSRMILERILEKIWDVLLMQETIAGHDISEIEGQYCRFWIEQKMDQLNLEHSDVEDHLEHHGILGQKWGSRNGPPYPINSQLKNKTPAEVKEIKNYKGKLYWLSESDMDGRTLIPRVPKNYFTENDYEDNQTPRLCFAPSVGQCLTALSQNVTGKTYTVYEPEEMPESVWKPNKGAVPDSEITGELWVKEPVKLKATGRIKVTGDDGKDGMRFEYGDKTAELYGWNYEDILSHGEAEVNEDLYGVPELKKFPMPDKKHVKSAIRFFNYVDPKYEKELAEAIIEKAEEFGLDLENDISVGDENRFGKYLKKEES